MEMTEYQQFSDLQKNIIACLKNFHQFWHSKITLPPKSFHLKIEGPNPIGNLKKKATPICKFVSVVVYETKLNTAITVSDRLINTTAQDFMVINL